MVLIKERLEAASYAILRESLFEDVICDVK